MSNSYYENRLKALGITEELNHVKLLKYDSATQQNVLADSPVFKPHEKGIEIIVYNLQCEQPTYRQADETIDAKGRAHLNGGSRYKKNWSIIRHEKPIVKDNGDIIKYTMPKGQGSHPFFPPQLIDKYERKEKIKHLILTEGFFKAFKGAMHGLDIIGLPSITHLRNKETDTLHPDILDLIKTCAIERVTWLVDGDCNDLSEKAADDPETDLFKRPQNFFNSVATFKRLLDDTDCDKYFMYVNTDGIMAELKTADRSYIKGLDDVMCCYPDKIPEMVEDINAVSKPGFWFMKTNLTFGLMRVRTFFLLNDITQFYLYHSERTPHLIKNKTFKCNGTKYQYDESTNKVEVIIPAAANDYFRCGNDFYKFVMKPNKYKQLERTIKPWLKSTIRDDHGESIFKYIPKYEGFCNVPDHTNFQPVWYNHFNIYSELDYSPVEEECSESDIPYTLGFLKHIFGENEVSFVHPKTKEHKTYTSLQLALDYIQLLYKRPWEKLPILCLVSKENNTGKTTFGKLLKIIFGGNCAVVGNQDLAGDFNKHWASRTIVICDETKIDKQTVVEKVKSLSTTDKIMMNAKGKDHEEIDCFIKFIFISNNEDNFISVSDEDIRYWVIKVPTVSDDNPGLLDNMIEEIPSFLAYLNKRKLATENLNRMWFHPSLLKTKALEKLVAYSKPVVIKEITQRIRDMFLDFGMHTVYMTRTDISREFFKGRYEENYLEKVLRDEMKVEQYSKTLPMLGSDGKPIKRVCSKRYSYPRWEQRTKEGSLETVRVDIIGHGRPYVFHIEQFLSRVEIETMDITEENNYINNNDPLNDMSKNDLPF